MMKETPDYKAILKTVIKAQIQMLVEQLAAEAEEESVILTASLTDGTSCYLGSQSGKSFLEGQGNFKTQFLQHCLKGNTSDDNDRYRICPNIRVQEPLKSLAESINGCSKRTSEHLPRLEDAKRQRTSRNFDSQRSFSHSSSGVETSTFDCCNKELFCRPDFISIKTEDVTSESDHNDSLDDQDKHRRSSNIELPHAAKVAEMNAIVRDPVENVESPRLLNCSLKKGKVQPHLEVCHSVSGREPKLELDNPERDFTIVKNEMEDDDADYELAKSCREADGIPSTSQRALGSGQGLTELGTCDEDAENSNNENAMDSEENEQYYDQILATEMAAAKGATHDENMDLKKFMSSSTKKSTAKSTKWGLAVFKTWKSTNAYVFPDLLHMSKQTLSHWLTKFVREVRSAKGEEYPPRTIYLILCALLRYLRDHGVHDKNFLDSKDPDFKDFWSKFEIRMIELHNKGMGKTVKQADVILEEDEEKLWQLSVFGTKDAQTLQYTVFFYCCKLFGLRGRIPHRGLQCSDFEVGKDCIGKYIKFIGSKIYKDGVQQMGMKNTNIKHYCNEGPRCLADIFQLYLDALGNEGDFYRKPLKSVSDHIYGYSCHAVGINKLGQFMKEIAEKGGLKGYYTNHSAKRTCATMLYKAGVEEKQIMARLGFRCEAAVRKYKCNAENTVILTSNALDPNKLMHSSESVAEMTGDKQMETQ